MSEPTDVSPVPPTARLTKAWLIDEIWERLPITDSFDAMNLADAISEATLSAPPVAPSHDETQEKLDEAMMAIGTWVRLYEQVVEERNEARQRAREAEIAENHLATEAIGDGALSESEHLSPRTENYKSAPAPSVGQPTDGQWTDDEIRRLSDDLKETTMEWTDVSDRYIGRANGYTLLEFEENGEQYQIETFPEGNVRFSITVERDVSSVELAKELCSLARNAILRP